MDVEGHAESAEFAATLAALGPKTHLLRVLGSYPEAG